MIFALIYITQSMFSQVVGPGDWSSLRLYGHAFNVNGFSDTDYEWIKNHNYFFTTEKRNARNIYGDPSSEQGSAVASAQVKANNPDSKPLFYWNASVIYDGIYESISEKLPDNPDWVGEDGRWNYSNESFRDWWLKVAVNQINNNAEEGIFIDAVPNVFATNSDENYAHFLDMMDQLPGFVLYNGFFTSRAGRLLAGMETLEHADGVYVETFLHFNCDTPEKGKQMLDALLEVPNDKVIITNNLPEDVWNATDHQFGMAAHLIIANENSYHRYYTTGGYDQSQLTIWHEDFGRYIGEPKGKAIVDDYVYTRDFENASVTIDLLNKTSSIVWGTATLNIDSYELENSDLGFSVYPNPITDAFSINNDLTIQKIEIFDVQGEKVKELNKSQESYLINDLAMGIYFIKLKVPNGNYQIVKVIKK